MWQYIDAEYGHAADGSDKLPDDPAKPALAVLNVLTQPGPDPVAHKLFEVLMPGVMQPRQAVAQSAWRFVRFDRLAPDFGITYSRMHIDRLEKAGKFPKRVPLGKNSVAWIEAEIIAWQLARIEARDKPPPEFQPNPED